MASLLLPVKHYYLFNSHVTSEGNIFFNVFGIVCHGELEFANCSCGCVLS